MKERFNYLSMAAVTGAIIVVILSPLIERVTPLGNAVGLTQGLYQIVYLLSVPALACCAGFFAEERRERGASLFQSSLLMLCIYIAAQWATFAIYKAFFVTDETFSFFYPKEGLWLLLAMACWLFAGHLSRRFAWKYVMPAALAAGMLAGLLGFLDEFPVLGQTLAYFPFFMLGLRREERLQRPLSGKKRLLMLAGLLAVCLCLLAGKGWLAAYPFYLGELAFSDMALGAVLGCVIRLVWYAVTFAVLWIILRLLPERKTILSAMGSHGLLEYVLGTLLVSHILECHKIFYNNIVYAWNYYGPLAIGLLIAIGVQLPILKKPYDWLAQAGGRLLERIIDSETLRRTDDFPYVGAGRGKKLLLALPVGFFLGFTLFFFTPVELYLGNKNYLNFAFGDLWPVLAIAGTVVCLLAACLCFCGGRVFGYGVTLLFGLTLCAYLQGNFWNGHLGSLDGTEVPWGSYRVEMAQNGLLWLCVLAFLFWLCRHYAGLWKGVLGFGSFLLSAMQLTALAVLLLGTQLQERETSYFDVEKQFVLSDEENVIVFILDHFDNDVLDEILEESPDFLEPLTGFTYYHNMTSRYVRTFPAVAYLLSGEDYFFDRFPEEWEAQIFEDNRFWKRAGELGYQGRVFVSPQYTIGKASHLAPYVDNVKYDLKRPQPLKLFGKMMQLSGYRNAPLVLKKYFWMYSEEMNALVRNGYYTDDETFFDTLRKQGLSVAEEPPDFVFYHLNGAHPPYRLDRNGNYMDKATSEEEAARGSMAIVYEYIRQMKELGIYDNSSVVITADHGEVLNHGELEETTNPILLVKPAGASAAAGCRISEAPVSHADYFDTVLSLMGDEDACDAVMDVREDAYQRPRYLYRSVSEPNAGVEDYQLETWEITGNANDFSCWKRIGLQYNEHTFY